MAEGLVRKGRTVRVESAAARLWRDRQLIEEQLKAFAVDVTVVRRSPGPNTLTPDQWRARLSDFDWVILAVPATPETDEGAADAE